MKDLTRLVIGTVALFMTFAPSPSFAQMIQPIDGLAVFDDNGEWVGPVVRVWNRDTTLPEFQDDMDKGLNGGVWFSMTVNDTTVLLAVDQNSTLYGSGVNELVFESIDCTSPPLFRNSFLNSNLLPSDTVVGGPNPAQAGGGGNNIVYIPDPNDTPRSITTLARTSRGSGGARSEVCDPGPPPEMIEAINAIQLIDIDAVFTRPFHVHPDVAQKKGKGPKN